MLTKRGRSTVFVLDTFPHNALPKEGRHEQASVAFSDRPRSCSAARSASAKNSFGQHAIKHLREDGHTGRGRSDEFAATSPEKCCEKVSLEGNAANKGFDTSRKYAESKSWPRQHMFPANRSICLSVNSTRRQENVRSRILSSKKRLRLAIQWINHPNCSVLPLWLKPINARAFVGTIRG